MCFLAGLVLNSDGCIVVLHFRFPHFAQMQIFKRSYPVSMNDFFLFTATKPINDVVPTYFEASSFFLLAEYVILLKQRGDVST
jgi:hypothetical protein